MAKHPQHHKAEREHKLRLRVSCVHEYCRNDVVIADRALRYTAAWYARYNACAAAISSDTSAAIMKLLTSSITDERRQCWIWS